MKQKLKTSVINKKHTGWERNQTILKSL